MSRRPACPQLLVALATAAMLFGAAGAEAQIPAGNLVQNPGAEAGGGAENDSTIATPPQWSAAGSFTAVRYGTPLFPSTLSSTIGGGVNFFAGGPGAASSIGEQTLDVSAAATEIDAGSVSVTLRADLGGFATDGDDVQIAAALEDSSSDTTFATLQIGPVSAADRGNQTTLLPRSTTAAVPAGTRHIRLTLTATRAAGFYNDGYADNVSVTLDADPVAVDDTATVARDSGSTALDVLANDTDPDGGPKRVVSVTQPAGGEATVATDGASVAYAPGPGACTSGGAPDRFGYTINGGASATVAVTVDCGSAPPPPTPPPPVARVVAVAATPVVAGAPARLNASVTGAPERLEWDLTGDGRPEVSCPGTQTTLGFRAPAGTRARAFAFAARVTVRAIDASGAATTFSQAAPAVAAARPRPADPAVDRVIDAFAKVPSVFTCGRAEDLAGVAFEQIDRRGNPDGFIEALGSLRCEERTIITTVLRIRGCFTPIRSAAQLPAAELGSIKPLIDIGRPPKRAEVLSGKDAPAGRFVELALDFAEAYLSRGPVLLNGVTLTPADAARIVVFPQVGRVFSSNAAMSVGGIGLESPKAFSLGLTGTNDAGQIPLGTFKRRPGGVRELGNFALGGDVRVTLVAGGAEIRTQLKLPAFLSVAGISAQSGVKLRVTDVGRLVLDDLQIGPIDAGIGPVGIQGLQLDYTAATRVWRGMGQICLTFACLDARELPGEAPPGGVVIRDGELERLYANVSFPGPGITLFPGVQLNRIGAGFGLNPTRLLGGARLTAAGIFQIDGALTLAFPSSAAPFTLTRQEAGNAFPADFYTRRYTSATLAVGADASLRVPLVGTIPLGGAYLLYTAPAYVAFGGGVNVDLLGIVSVRGRLDGEFNFANGRFDLAGQARACLVDLICAQTVARISSRGAGACVTVLDYGVDDVNIGGGVQYNPFRVIIWPFDGCRWTRFAERNVFGASAAQAGRPITVQVRAGDRSRAVQLEGRDGAPRVRVTIPGGERFESTPGPGIGPSQTIRILRSEQAKTTVIGLKDPKPGTYTIETLAGSPPITRTSEAEDLPKARITARVSTSNKAARRTITYDILRRPDQRVTFVEVGPEGRRPVGTVTGGGRGTLAFVPAPGGVRRAIEAQVELAGLPAETLTVARFTPPSPRLGRPARVRASRSASALRVRWSSVPGATRYEVVATAASGEQRVTRTARTTATLARVPSASGGVVAVRATATLRQGATRTVRFRASGPRARTRFGPLPRLEAVR